MPTETDQDRLAGGTGPVLDPGWEEALVSAADAEGERGSLEADLAMVHLLVHARAPEALGDRALEAVWAEIDGGLAKPWWRKKWVVFGVPVFVGAAAALVLVLRPTMPATQDDALVADHRGMKDALESQFAVLEPGARAAVAKDVERGRGHLRGELLAAAKRDAGGSIGGAP